MKSFFCKSFFNLSPHNCVCACVASHKMIVCDMFVIKKNKNNIKKSEKLVTRRLMYARLVCLQIRG